MVSGALKKSDSWVRFLITLEKLYPTYVTDLELIQEIERIPRVKEYPTTADIAQYIQKFTTLTDQLATSYYDDSKALLHLLPRVPPKTMDKIRATPERLSRIHTFNSLVDLLYELALQRKSDATLKNLHSMAQLKWLDGNTNADFNAPMNQEEAFAHSLCEECFVSFQQARGQAKKVARVRAWRLELFELVLPEQERTEHQQFWIINSETWKAFLTALAISNAPENDEKRR